MAQDEAHGGCHGKSPQQEANNPGPAATHIAAARRNAGLGLLASLLFPATQCPGLLAYWHAPLFFLVWSRPKPAMFQCLPRSRLAR